MKRIRNTQIANKIIKSNQFEDYTRYSLQACFARALELEGDFQVGEVVTLNYAQAQVLTVEGEGFKHPRGNFIPCLALSRDMVAARTKF